MHGETALRLVPADQCAPESMGIGGERLARVRGGLPNYVAQCLMGERVLQTLQELPDAFRASTPFQSPFWLAHWTYAFASAACEPLLVVIHRDSDPVPVMVMPLARRDVGGRRMIECLDAGVTDYNAPLLRDDFSPSEQEADSLWDAFMMALPAADILLLDKMPRQVGERINPLSQIAAAHESQLHGNLVPVGDDFEAYVRGFHRKYRKELGREKRVFEAFEGARFVAAKSLDEAAPIMNALERIQAARMQDLHRDYDLDSQDKQDFYRAMLRDGLAQGSVTLTALMVKDEVIAALYCINHNGHCAMVRIAQAGGAWSVCSPGRLIILETMRWLHGKGYRVFDFTIGAYDYKRRLGALHVPLCRVMVALSLGGQFSVTCDAVKRRLRALPLLRTWVQKLRRQGPKVAED